jgi:zona occludens toxin (predicted ATPase)
VIILITGVPGSGKTLYTLHQVKTRVEAENARFEAEGKPPREVHYSGIADLKLPWIELEDPTKWNTLPPGSIIVIDECQRVFRPRGSGATVPPYIADLETHRHKGYDIYLITQHAMLVDQNIRRLVGKHQHIVRKFGISAATLKRFPDLPDAFDVIHVDDKTEEGRQKWARWFHWAPLGAFFFVDEAQDIFPKSWRDADLSRFDYPGGVEQAAADGRPFDWAQAWDKHRHYNWDFVLTTPAYRKIRDDIKGVADAAYKHKDLALIGWTGRYIEAMHLADDSGASQSDFMNVTNKKVPKYVFELYDSTSTGAFGKTASGTSLLKNPRVLMHLPSFLRSSSAEKSKTEIVLMIQAERI